MPSNVMIRKQYVKKQPYCFIYKVKTFYGEYGSQVVSPPFDLNGCSSNVSITVDYGDGTIMTFTSEDFYADYSSGGGYAKYNSNLPANNSNYYDPNGNRTLSVALPSYHLYTDGLSEHTIKVYSNNFSEMNFCSLADGWMYVSEILTPIPKVKGITYRNFDWEYNETTQQWNSKNTGKQENSLRNLFCQGSSDFSYGATFLTTLSPELFKNNSQITDISYCFSYCNNIEIPSDIFKYLTNIQNMNNCFDGTSDVYNDILPASIENNELFIYSPNVTSINQMLYNSDGIVGYDSDGRTPLPEPNLKIYVPENTTTETTFINAQFSIVYYDNSRNDENVFEHLNLTIVSLPNSMNSFEYTINTEKFSSSYSAYQNIITTGIPFNLYGTQNTSITVLWGDGTSSTFTSNDYTEDGILYDTFVNGYENFVHTYSESGTYKVKIFSNDFDKIQILTSRIFVFWDYGIHYSTSWGAYLQTLVSIDTKLPQLNQTDFGYFCYAFNDIQIPNDLFSANPQATNFEGCFFFCNAITEIPKDIFKYNVNATNFGRCFENCTSLTSIPEDLFKYNTAVTDFGSCFSNCTLLTLIPKDLFKYNINADSFGYCFGYCTSLTSIPTDLFKHNTVVTNFQYCFTNCTALTTIPTDLFKYNTLVTNFYQCFYWCTALTTIPTDLFKYNTLVTTFRECFYFCISLNDFTLRITSPDVSNCKDFISTKSGITRTVYVPTGSTTQTTFNNVASSLGLTIIAE